MLPLLQLLYVGLCLFPLLAAAAVAEQIGPCHPSLAELRWVLAELLLLLDLLRCRFCSGTAALVMTLLLGSLQEEQTESSRQYIIRMCYYLIVNLPSSLALVKGGIKREIG